MPRITRLALLGGSVLLTATAAVHATGQSPDIHPTTPYEYWHDYCGYPDVIPNSYEIVGGSLNRMLSAEAMLVRVGQIVPSDDPNYWRFTGPQPNIYAWGTTDPVVGDLPFYGDLILAPNVRTGFLIGPDIIATAPHTLTFDPRDFVVVFNVTAKKDPVTQQCVPPDPEHIPASDVFLPKTCGGACEPLITTTLPSDGSFDGVDYAAFYIDGVPAGHPYLRIRKTGSISSSDTLAMAGHPFGLRTKLQFGIGYAGQQSNPMLPAMPSYPTFNDYYTFPGMSGSPVFNLDRNYVEVLDSHGGYGCLSSMYSPVYEMHDICDDVAEPGYLHDPPTHVVNEGPISVIADDVPTMYLRVSPLDDVTYVVPVGGSPTPAQTVYTAVASSHETASTSVQVGLSPTTMPPNEPGISIGSYSTSLAPGASTNITLTASVPASATCGIYNRTVAIIDQTHGFRDIMWHRFELGMTDFTISSAQALDLYAISAPSMPAQITFTLTNTRPTATTVAVSASPSWASLSSSSVSLAAAGQPGASATVSLSLATAAFSLAAGDYPITLSFADQSGCALTPTREQTVVFHKGKLVLTQSFSDVFVPMPTPPGSPTQSYIDIPESACISDMSVRLDTVNGSDAGDPLSVWSPHLGLSLDYAHGTTSYSLPLWANNALPTGWTVPTAYDPDLFADIETLLLDRHANTPPNGANWSLYVGKNAPAGRWTLKITDDGVGSVGRNGAIVPQWTLELVGTPATCRVSL